MGALHDFFAANPIPTLISVYMRFASHSHRWNGSGILFPYSYAATGNRTHVSSVAPHFDWSFTNWAIGAIALHNNNLYNLSMAQVFIHSMIPENVIGLCRILDLGQSQLESIVATSKMSYIWIFLVTIEFRLRFNVLFYNRNWYWRFSTMPILLPYTWIYNFVS